LLLFRFLHILVKYRSSIYTPSVNILRVDWLGIYTFVKGKAFGHDITYT
jgi:hypothetical protein